jgi:micrococcal nuclease
MNNTASPDQRCAQEDRLRKQHHFVRCWLLAIGAGLLALFASSLAGESKTPTPDFKSLQAYKVMRVVDGDTIVVDLDGKAEKVRLVGVDTPEAVHPGKPVAGFGKEASDFTHRQLDGEKVFLVCDPNNTAHKHRDRYGRLLAYVYRERDKLDLCAELVKQGYAHAYLKYPSKRGEEFLGYQKEAREAKRGLWGDNSSAKEQAEDSGKEAGKDPKEITVYITRTGHKYHCAGCRCLAKSKIATSLVDAMEKYEPCKVCNPPR